jgi:hypothetical protein
VQESLTYFRSEGTETIVRIAGLCLALIEAVDLDDKTTTLDGVDVDVSRLETSLGDLLVLSDLYVFILRQKQ